MTLAWKRALALGLSLCLIMLPTAGARTQAPPPQAQPAKPLRDYLQMSYRELFDVAPQVQFSAAQFEAQRDVLEQGKDLCVTRFKDRAKQYQKQLDAAQKELKKSSPGLTDAQRKAVHCDIQNLALVRSEAQVLAEHAIPTAYDNLNAKLELMQQWPAQYQQARQEIASGAYLNRRWGDVKDIGFRVIAANQQDDIKTGQQAAEELRRAGVLPPELENKAIQQYVQELAQKLARNSDLKIPLHVVVLQSREINALALPGGYLFVERGLLEASDDEAELAGVLAHEMAHDAARHGHKLMKRATIASILYQVAQVAALVLTGGAAGAAAYYGLQYGFYGLGLFINLDLLGVSRSSELEADQLGMQYAWKAGYDPSGFTRFFDKIATREGYVNGVSWFRTHPPFYGRMVAAEREMMFLPANPQAIVTSSAFEQMKRELAPIAAQAERADLNKPSLLISREEGCTPPAKIEYKPGQSIEQLCAQPMLTPGGR